MKASELRIGNLITFKNRDSSDTEMFVEVGDLFRIEQDENGYNPIKLTEEWLLKFGFEKQFKNMPIGRKSYSLILYHNHFCFISYEDDFFVRLYSSTSDFSIEIKYVHQLQNLYFALTNEELILKP